MGKLRYGLIGCGRISPNHIAAVQANQDNIELVAVCDIVPERMDLVLTQAGVDSDKVKKYTDYHVMLDSEGLDLVAIAVVVYGDTNSTLAGALAASKLHIPIFHVEAGLRSYNKLMPEEQNRVLTDHLSTLLLCPTRTAVNNLAKEGITEGVFFTGDIMYDAVLRFSTLSEQRYGNGRWLREMANVCNNEISKLSTKNYYLATIHRAENTDNKDRLQEIFEAFGELDKPVLVPMHPRTRHVIGDSISSLASNIIVIEPVGYLLMLYLTANAYMVLTDSGGLQKEAYFLKTPCTTLRDETEWIETLENGWNVLSTVDSSSIIRNATRPLSCLQQDQQMEFGEGRAAEMIVERIEERLGA